jgi:hypothetical protein
MEVLRERKVVFVMSGPSAYRTGYRLSTPA